jgi:hypothetical protein
VRRFRSRNKTTLSLNQDGSFYGFFPSYVVQINLKYSGILIYHTIGGFAPGSQVSILYRNNAGNAEKYN